jgi:hypothetical protein
MAALNTKVVELVIEAIVVPLVIPFPYTYIPTLRDEVEPTVNDVLLEVAPPEVAVTEVKVVDNGVLVVESNAAVWLAAFESLAIT